MPSIVRIEDLVKNYYLEAVVVRALRGITLSVAKQLRQQLLATGRFRVAMTRDKDVFVPLRDRFKIARDKGADLFISLHADSNPSGQARGASVYTLSDKASDAEAEALATKENKSDVIAGVDLSKENQTVTGILIDLAQRETINMSSRFASILVNDLQNDTLMLQNSHRFAGFAVLKAPDVPCRQRDIMNPRGDWHVLKHASLRGVN